MDCLYHYCTNEKAFNILKNHNIRMGDISKSNGMRLRKGKIKEIKIKEKKKNFPLDQEKIFFLDTSIK